MKNNYGASFVAAAFAILQNSDTDKAMYYDALPTRAYCGLYEFPSFKTTATYDTFKAYNALYKLGSQCQAEITEPKVKILAAGDGKDGAILIANHNAAPCTMQLEIKNAPQLKYCLMTDDNRRSEPVAFNGANLELPPYSLAIISSFDINEATGSSDNAPQPKVNHAGLDSGN